MKNKFNFLLILATGIFITLGCGAITDRVQKSVTGDNSSPQTANSNKSLIDQTTEDVADGETTGIPECDEVVKIFSDYAKSPDDNWMTKATKDYFVGQIKKSFRQSLAENKNDKVKMAQQCSDYKKQLETNLKAEQANKK